MPNSMQNSTNFNATPGLTKTGPTNTGKDISSRNSIKHGGCATGTLILASESLDEYLELEARWLAGYGVNPQNPHQAHETELIRTAARAEWFFFRAERNYADMEAQLLNTTPDLLQWTNEQHQSLQRLLRYRTANANLLTKARKSYEDYRKHRDRDYAFEHNQRRLDEKMAIAQAKLEIYRLKNKPELTWDEHLEGMRQEAVKLGFVRTPPPPPPSE